jgi:hypothetical protein
LTDAGATGVTPILAKQIVNTTLAANAINAPVVLGSATTVPTNALSVRISVFVSLGKSNGALVVTPNGVPSGGIDPAIVWETNDTRSTTIIVGVGTANKVTFKNVSTGSVKVVAKVTGWAGAAQPQKPGEVLAGAEDGSAEWTEPGITLASDTGVGPIDLPPVGTVEVAHTSFLAPGKWLIEYTDVLYGGGYAADQVGCVFEEPLSHHPVGSGQQIVLPPSPSSQTLVMRLFVEIGGEGAQINVQCGDVNGTAHHEGGTGLITATRVGIGLNPATPVN